VAANASFVKEQDFPYRLLCDTERALCIAYGACEDTSAGSAKRITYVIGADGRIEQAHASVTPAEHAQVLLDSL
jgi:peroxiredoxin